MSPFNTKQWQFIASWCKFISNRFRIVSEVLWHARGGGEGTHKLYFYDTGLVSYLLGLESAEHVTTHPLRGALFENMVVSEFYKRRFNQGKSPHLFYYRDNSQKEIDLIEEESFGQLYAYEIKSSKRFNTQFYAGIDYFKKLYGESVVGGTVLYDGNETIKANQIDCLNWKAPFLNHT